MLQRPALLALSAAALTAALALTGCDKEEVKPDSTPRVGVLELGTAHRFSDPAPAGPAHIEISPSELVLEGEQVIPLENGKLPAAEKSGYEIPKLKAKLSGKQSLALSVHAAVPYATLARVMYTGSEAGIKDVAFKVRKPNSTNQVGYIDIKQFHFIKSPDAADFTESELVSWDKWTAVWDDALSSCQAAGPKADCGYSPMAKAQGGKLDLMLRVRGTGFALRFRQAGAAEAVADAGAPVAAADPKKKDKKKKKKAEMLDGIKAAPEAAEEEAPPEPSHEHVFTLRTDQATADPSPISGIVKPLCSSLVCPVVLDVEGVSISGPIFGLLGAAFPDGTTAPKVAFVLPPP
ncbi:MAG TPA: hypothetical protein VFX59_04850 [Polyangiales bacterium]|nr:hypothetical protein [Polyangiales bacterium]